MRTGGRLVRVPATPPQDLEAEQAVLGAVMLASANTLAVCSDARLRPDCFYRDAHARLYAAMVAIDTRGDHVDTLTLGEELERRGELEAIGGRATLDVLAAGVPNVGNVRAYVRRVVELHEWRVRYASTLEGAEAVAELDHDKWMAAMRALDQLEEQSQASALLTPDQLASDYFDYLAHGDTTALPTPWAKLDEIMRGGFRPGDTTIVAGWTGMGKSVAADQIVAHARPYVGERGCCIYVNEMGETDRVGRLIAGRSNVSFTRLQQQAQRTGQRLTEREWAAVADALNNGLPYALQPCAGWSGDEIARSLRRHRWGMAAIDLATQIPAREVADWDHISQVLTIAARESGTHLLILVQLNQQRATLTRPIPVLRDLRGTGAWGNDARNVLFVHRHEEDRDGVAHTGEDGVLFLAKQSNGPQGIFDVTLNERTMRLEPLDDYRVDAQLSDRIAP